MISIFAFCAIILLANNSSYCQDKRTDGSYNYNIEGVFTCDFSGNYYLRQIGNEVLWYGEDDNVNPLWSNVAHGTINGDVLTVIWADVPKGSIMQHGKLFIKINSNDNFIVTSQEGDNFASSNWNRKKIN